MDFMKGIVILVKVDEMYNIVKFARQDKDRIGWSTFLLETALERPYFTTLLLY